MFFPFLDSFFYISLAITFGLILLMVYHFKNRIHALEEKNQDMGELCQMIIKELQDIKQIQTTMVQLPQQAQPEPPQPSYLYTQVPGSYQKLVVTDDVMMQNMDEDLETEVIEDDDEEEPDTSNNTFVEEVEFDSAPNVIVMDIDNMGQTRNRNLMEQFFSSTQPAPISEFVEELDEEDQDQDDDQDEDDYQEEPIESKTVELDTQSYETHETEDIQVLKMPETEESISVMTETENQNTKNGRVPIDKKNNPYAKMTVQMLRTSVISKGLCSDASKIRKPELVYMLTQHDAEEVVHSDDEIPDNGIH